MYEPPSQNNWVCTHHFDAEYALAYHNGYNAAKDGLSLKNNPYKPSGHERETTYNDELHYWWYSGFIDCEQNI